MAGAPEFRNQSSIESFPGKRIRYVSLSFQSEIIAGSQQNINLYAPTGYLSRIVSMSLNYNGFASTTGVIQILVSGASGNVGILQTYGASAGGVNYYFGELSGGTTRPSDPTGQQICVDKAIFDDQNSVMFSFENQTDVSDGGVIKQIDLWILDEQIAG